MLEQHTIQALRLQGTLFQILAACSIGIALGAASILLTPPLALGALLVVGLMFALLKRPELGILGILVATSSIVFENKLPLINVGVGSLHVSDFMLLAMLGLVVIRSLIEPGFKLARTSLNLPLIALYGAGLLSTLLAVSQSTVEIEEARRAIRPITYYLTFFVIINLVREESRIRLLLRGLYILASVVAGAMALQYLLGVSVPILPGRVETLQTQGMGFSGISRITPPGQSLVLVVFIIASVTLALEGDRPISILKLLQWNLLGLALLLTFNRSYWVAAGLVLTIAIFLMRPRNRRRLIGIGTATLLLTFMIVLSASPSPDAHLAKLIDASIMRLATLGDAKILSEGSLQWRFVENEYALREIASHPFLGLGLGAKYRPFDPRIDTEQRAWDPRGYIHNGHLWIALKMGLIGYCFFVWLSLAFIMRGGREWRHIGDSQLRASSLGLIMVYSAVLVASITSPLLVEWSWTPVIGLVMGMNEAILRTVKPPDS